MAPRVRPGRVVDLGAALELLFARLGPIGGARTEDVPLAQAMERVLAADVPATRAVPDGPRAAMDGFAVTAGKVLAPGGPAGLKLAGLVLAGGTPPPLPPAGTVFVATGARLPPGADAIVPRELAAWDRSDADGQPLPGATVHLRRAVEPGAHVMPVGEWVQAGIPVLRAGTRLQPAALGLLATLGRQEVSVIARPRVVILATGDELVAPGHPLPPGGMYDSNAQLLAAACAAAGAEATVLPHVPDRLADLRAALRTALEVRPQLILSSGGVSVGPADLVPQAWRALGAEEIFWRVAIKPGKPVFAARHGSTAVLGLSGSPAACWTAFTVLAGPLLRHWSGWPQPFPAAQRVPLAAPLAANPDVPRLLWAQIGPDGAAHLPLRRAPGVLAHMAAANGLLVQGAGTGALPAGAPVWVLRTDRVGEVGAVLPQELLQAAAKPGTLDLSPGPPSPPAAAPAVCAIGGWSGHGKTTLLEKLIALFAASGEPVATLKHHAHGTPADVPGKDGFRHRAAGARLTVVAGPGGILWSETADGDPDPEALLAQVRARAAAAGCRWLLVEGYHGMPLPRVEVLDSARSAIARCGVADGLFLIAAATPGAVTAPAGVEVVSRDAVAEIAAAIRTQCVPGAAAGRRWP